MAEARNIRTDLALEAHEFIREKAVKEAALHGQQMGAPQVQQGAQQGASLQGTPQEQQGVQQGQHQEQHQEQGMPGVVVENAGDDDIKITRVRVTSPAGEKSIGKPMGNYITLEIPGLRNNDQVLYENTCKTIASELANLLKLGPSQRYL